MSGKGQITELIQRAKTAQKEYEKFSQEKVDKIVRAIAKVVHDNAEMLARMAIDETGMGVYEDKVAKNRGKARIIWNSLKNKKSVGIIKTEEETGLIHVAKPMGVVGMVTPCTNPIVTPMCNSMFALKGRNAAIIAPHPRGKVCGKKTVDLINEELAKLGAPGNLIQIIEEPSIELTGELMRSVDVVIATGGMGMVRAAYSSGKPSFGVGAGNVQVIFDTGIDFNEAAEKVIVGRTFDNGIICSGEQSIITPEKDYDNVVNAFAKAGCFYVSDEAAVAKFRETLFTETGGFNRDLVGQSVQTIAKAVGVDVPEGTRVIILKTEAVGNEDVLCKEKMGPVMIITKYKTIEDAVRIAQGNLDYEGKGHSAAIHSNNLDHIKFVGENLTVSRVVVNQTSSTSAGGSFKNGFAPSTTLGCGSWGNNSISENLDYKHLINITRIGLLLEDAKVPSDDELWSM